MRKNLTAALLVGVCLSVNSLFALTSVPADWQSSNTNAGEATSGDKSKFVAMYRNEYGLFDNDPSGHTKKLADQPVSQPLADQLTAQAGNPPSMTALIGAVQKAVAANPNNLVDIVVAAISVEKKLLPAQNGDGAAAIVAAALMSLPANFEDKTNARALIIGFAVQSVDPKNAYAVLVQLRSLVLAQTNNDLLVPTAKTLDEALAEEGILTAKKVSEEFQNDVLAMMQQLNQGDTEDAYNATELFGPAAVANFNFGFIDFVNFLQFTDTPNGVLLPNAFGLGGLPGTTLPTQIVPLNEPLPTPTPAPPSS